MSQILASLSHALARLTDAPCPIGYVRLSARLGLTLHRANGPRRAAGALKWIADGSSSTPTILLGR
jgi:hypothetical protein